MIWYETICTIYRSKCNLVEIFLKYIYKWTIHPICCIFKSCKRGNKIIFCCDFGQLFQNSKLVTLTFLSEIIWTFTSMNWRKSCPKSQRKFNLLSRYFFLGEDDHKFLHWTWSQSFLHDLQLILSQCLVWSPILFPKLLFLLIQYLFKIKDIWIIRKRVCSHDAKDVAQLKTNGIRERLRNFFWVCTHSPVAVSCLPISVSNQ